MAIQASSGSTRERWVKSLLPAAIIVMAYMLLINVGNGRQIRSLKDDLEDQQGRAVTESDLATVAMRHREAADQRDQLQEQLAQAQSELDRSVQLLAAGSPTERTMQISQLCQQLSIGLLAQKPAGRVETSPLRQQAIATLRKLAPDRDINFRELQLVGSYANIVTLMQRLPVAVQGTIPLGIELLDLQQQDSGSSQSTGTLDPGNRAWRVYVLM